MILLGKLNALSNEMIVYKAPKEQHVITVFTDITCGYCHKLHEQMSDYNALGITVRYLARWLNIGALHTQLRQRLFNCRAIGVRRS